MLKRLELRNVGPASHLALNPVAPRFNFLTGDNGLGKSFLLEASWWALTRTWHESPAVPNSPEASVSYSFDGLERSHS
jgi:recombinational DNA repair ATPase RecF